ncbi:MAG: hypothetical protein NUV57_06450 [archaeon]|nr:hypothetical protein [archaeon]
MINELLLEKRNGKNSTKSNILSILGEMQPLNAKQIHSELKNQYANSSTYQAVHKTLKELQETGILKEFNHQYTIETKWIANTKKHLENIEKTAKTLSAEELQEKKIMYFEFDKFIEIAEFALFEFSALPNPDKKPYIGLSYHVWPSLALSNKQFVRFKEFLTSTQTYILAKSDTILDRIAKKAFEKHGTKVKMGAELPFTPDTLVQGDFIAYVYFDYKGKKLYDQFSKATKNLTNLNISEIFETLFETQFKHKILVIYNPEIAEEIRRNALKEFGVKK